MNYSNSQKIRKAQTVWMAKIMSRETNKFKVNGLWSKWKVMLNDSCIKLNGPKTYRQPVKVKYPEMKQCTVQKIKTGKWKGFQPRPPSFSPIKSTTFQQSDRLSSFSDPWVMTGVSPPMTVYLISKVRPLSFMTVQSHPRPSISILLIVLLRPSTLNSTSL